ncbi:MAG: plastocyanin/azurin family copper-binding protein [Candidatus Dormibacteria bacterium]
MPLLLLVAACAGGSGNGPGAPSGKAVDGCRASQTQSQVTVDATSKLRFVPARVCLRAGGVITWTNTTRHLDHTSTDEPALEAAAGDAGFPAGANGWNLRLPAGHSAHLTLRVKGVYHYFCIPHETLGMVGKIVVVG